MHKGPEDADSWKGVPWVKKVESDPSKFKNV